MGFLRLLAVLGCASAFHEIADLYPRANASMKEILGANLQDGKPVNALVVLHLEGCVFCDITMGTLLYDMRNTGVLNATKIRPFSLLVDVESGSAAVLCTDHPDCVAQSKSILGVDLTAVTSFPTTMYYDASGARADVSDTPCGIAVRKDGPGSCKPSQVDACQPAADDLADWACNLHTKNETTDCATGASKAWERCVRD